MIKLLAVTAGVMIILLAACVTPSGKEKIKEDDKEKNEEPAAQIEAFIDQLSMDATVEASSSQAVFNFSLTNTGDKPLILGFNSGQQYEVTVKNSDGKVVYSYSDGKMFTQQLTTKELEGKQVLPGKETWNKVKEPGEYSVQITFLITSINDQPVEAQPFQVSQSFTIEDPQEQGSDPESKAFRNVEITGEQGSYTVKGEARVFEAGFLYSVEDGHRVQVAPTSVQAEAGAPKWGAFTIKINIPEDQLPDYGTLNLTLYEASPKDGHPIHVQYFQLEDFNS